MQETKKTTKSTSTKAKSTTKKTTTTKTSAKKASTKSTAKKTSSTSKSSAKVKTSATKKPATKKTTSTKSTTKKVVKSAPKKVDQVIETKVEPTTNVVENQQTSTVVVKEKKKDHLHLNKWKMLYMWAPLLNIKRKASKIVRKNRKYPDTYTEEYCYTWVKKAVNKLLYVLDVDIKVEGIENWLDKGVVLAVNHQSNIDPAILIAINNFSKQQPLAFIAKQELWTDKKFKNFVRLIDCIPLDRNSPRSALEAFKEARELVVDYKRSLVIFPEGTRSQSQEMNEFHPASLKVAQMAHAPIIPVSIINSYQVFAENRPKRVEIKVVFGKPILPSKHISLKTEDLTRFIQKTVQENLNKWEHEKMKYALKKLTKKDIKQLKEEELEKQKKAKKTKKKSVKDIFKIVD
ncbi:1-acyl-SN-glycerol-3-phosphate acyltransferase [Mycoplasma yeatsii 13926]|uniref:1-acyl-SN-glycerol-3-phosphate acyltransferase n=1 Tax=Mycoplasma yeatsii 13926 TaxID=1188240 RepID=S6G8B3_9MOLU|nr:lysophospholipid acyltransferase family protein [Mycoplasma yeatsii]EOA06985.1 1-acyl-SN-glycerol-3-phosphate acyltransferase [Mycoplasma yeatsii 13926]